MVNQEKKYKFDKQYPRKKVKIKTFDYFFLLFVSNSKIYIFLLELEIGVITEATVDESF